MRYYSLNKNAPDASFEEAVRRGIAPDKGLYFPREIKKLDTDFFEHIEYFSNNEIAFEVIKQFVGDEIPDTDLKKIIEETLSFDFPLVNIEDNISTLELFHGPTMAFKDVGARFMARCLGYFNRKNVAKKEVTVLVATSGDTGGAVASGFLDVPGTDVVILYPSGKVSDIQEKQLTTNGKNIKALEVDGTFDDCQDMVKQAFLDQTITKNVNLTSANSINIARWLPQMFYFFFAYKQIKNKKKELIFSVPSGNYGNICAGMMAKKMGLPIAKFIAAANANAVIPNFLETGNYEPQPTIHTISNAMDVGNPSNFIRIQEIYNGEFELLKNDLFSFSFSDEETRNAINVLKTNLNYISDPHGAVGYLGLKKFLQRKKTHGIFLETAHPVKFLDVVEPLLDTKLAIPEQIKDVVNKKKEAFFIRNYDELKLFLRNR